MFVCFVCVVWFVCLRVAVFVAVVVVLCLNGCVLCWCFVVFFCLCNNACVVCFDLVSCLLLFCCF